MKPLFQLAVRVGIAVFAAIALVTLVPFLDEKAMMPRWFASLLGGALMFYVYIFVVEYLLRVIRQRKTRDKDFKPPKDKDAY